jgi:siderophore synthetase component
VTLDDAASHEGALAEGLLADLAEGRWARANRELLAKILTELDFEDVIRFEPVDPAAPDGAQRLAIGEVALTFTARPRLLGHRRVDPASITLTRIGSPEPEALPDLVELLAEVGPQLGIEASTLANALSELTTTLVADAHQLRVGLPAAELIDASPLRIEGEMRGHPWIVANKGRIGFDLADEAAHAPERRRPLRLPWLAARRTIADARGAPGLTNTEVARQQLGEDGWADALDRLAAHGLDPAEVVLLPVHPWQWRERIARLHAGDLARGDLVPLGELAPRYLPQQSIRTFVDVNHPDRRYVKLALSILNTSVHRGIPRERALVAPALSTWLCDLARRDPFLQEAGLVLLGEVASASVAHRAFEAVPAVPYQHTEMLGAIWREPVDPHLAPGERAVTLAALLHRDPAGVAFVEPLVRRSGLSPAEWVDRLHRATLPPLAHVLYRYGVAFSPHAQNCMLVLRDDVPVRLVVKDFVDDLMISSEALPELADVPADLRATLGGGVEAPFLVQWLQGGLLVCVHRYLSEVFEDALGLPEATFWASAATALHDYQDRFPELDDRFALFDLDAPAFVKLCLNRVRIFERGYADDAERPIASASGWIDNPLALLQGAPLP